MAEFPSQLSIKTLHPEKHTESLLCNSLLRIIPGKREVYDALWGDRNVIVKVFSHKISARRHLKREWRGLSLLSKRGLSAPKPFFYGRTQDKRWAIVVEKIPDSPTAMDVFDKTQESAKRLELLILIGNELAKQHSKGVLHKDVHLGNFLLANERIFTLDTGQIRFLRCQARRKSSISKLAILASYLPHSDTESITRLCESYFESRDWSFGKVDDVSFKKQLAALRRKSLRKQLKKCLRSSGRHLRIKTNGYIAVLDRNFYNQAEPLDFIEKIDALMDEGQILKNGNTCYISRLMWNSKDVVIKRYNHKGLIHSLRHTIKGSRARRGWLHSHCLRILDIATPKPLAYIEQRRGSLVWKSYLVTKYIKGQRLYDFLRDDSITKEQRSIVIGQVLEMLNNMGKYHITHGDLKHTNILITDKGPFLTDLDAMTTHKSGYVYRFKSAKDISRFQKKLRL